MGIADYISYLLGADDVKEAKPKPEPVLKTLAAMQFAASETLVVGDMAVDIMMGANAAGKLADVGYKCVNLKGGIIAWKDANMPVIKEE